MDSQNLSELTARVDNLEKQSTQHLYDYSQHTHTNWDGTRKFSGGSSSGGSSSTTSFRNYGNGSDGAVDMDGTNTYSGFASKSSNVYTLTRDVFATTIKIETGVTLKTASFRIYGMTSFINIGSVLNNGNDGGAGNASTSGTAGAALPAGTVGGSASGAVPNNAGDSISHSLGGNGGGGSNGAGTATAPIFPLTKGFHQETMLDLSGTTFSQYTGGAGGGSGTTSGSPVRGGGGGGGGGIITISSPTVNNSGTISANGGQGGNNNTGGTAGGGGGGAIVFLTNSGAITNTGTVSASAGVGGGTAAAAGNIYYF